MPTQATDSKGGQCRPLLEELPKLADTELHGNPGGGSPEGWVLRHCCLVCRAPGEMDMLAQAPPSRYWKDLEASPLPTEQPHLPNKTSMNVQLTLEHRSEQWRSTYM